MCAGVRNLLVGLSGAAAAWLFLGCDRPRPPVRESRPTRETEPTAGTLSTLLGKADLEKAPDRVLCRVAGREITWLDLTGTRYEEARRLAEQWEARASDTTRDWWRAHCIQPCCGPPKGIPGDVPLFQDVLDAACQGLVDLVFLAAVYDHVAASHANARDLAFLGALDANMREFARCMAVLDEALAAVAGGEEAAAVFRERAELGAFYEEPDWVSAAAGGHALIRAFRREAFPVIRAGSSEPSPWVLLDYSGFALHKTVVEMAIADQAKYARMVVQERSLVSGAAIDVSGAQELAAFRKILDRSVDYRKGVVDYDVLEQAIQAHVSGGFRGRISLWKRQFPEKLEAEYPCDFRTSPVGVPLRAGEGENGRRRYCFILSRESTLDEPMEKLTVQNSGYVRNRGVREILRPYVEQVARTFEATPPWQTPDLDRVHQMVSSYPPKQLGTKRKKLPPVSRF